ncbi:hypothetical protein ANCCAN_03694 [Ancylostoma caninum]|uniref:Uncharacterized protein n=1 Tax=Ancylostoma caninum TaxID=29170 RepID=A0A368H384_ANCCA|nr:hypothetical protein ANCCAN_03694 [Ancylostoma caninum]
MDRFKVALLAACTHSCRLKVRTRLERRFHCCLHVAAVNNLCADREYSSHRWNRLKRRYAQFYEPFHKLCFQTDYDFRFVSIVFPTHYEALFSTRRMAYLLAFSYLLGLAVSIPTLFPCCHILWDSYYYTSTYTVTNTW